MKKSFLFGYKQPCIGWLTGSPELPGDHWSATRRWYSKAITTLQKYWKN